LFDWYNIIKLKNTKQANVRKNVKKNKKNVFRKNVLYLFSLVK